VGTLNHLDVVLRPPRASAPTPIPPGPPPTASDPVAAVFVEIWGSADRPDVPHCRIENRSSTGIDIVEIEMTVGDAPTYAFDTFYKDGGPMDFELLDPDQVHNSWWSSRFLVVFPGSSLYTASGGARFRPWDVLECRADVDPCCRDNATVNFRTILYNNGPSPNAELTVRFSDGTTLSGTWPDNGDTVAAGAWNALVLEHSMFLTTDE